MNALSKTPEDLIQREMSITHDDFFRLLPKALKQRDYKILKNGIDVALAVGNLQITLSQQTYKTSGSLVLPIIQVNFTFENCPEDVRKEFFEDFDLAFQKGGG